MTTINEYRSAFVAEAIRAGNFAGVSDGGRCISYTDGSNLCVSKNTSEAWKALFEEKFPAPEFDPARDVKRANVLARTMALAGGVPERDVDRYLALASTRRSLDNYLASEEERDKISVDGVGMGAINVGLAGYIIGGAVSLLAFIGAAIMAIIESNKADKSEAEIEAVLKENSLTMVTCVGEDPPKPFLCKSDDVELVFPPR